MITAVCWKWGQTFEALHVNVLRLMLERHLSLEHELVCITDDAAGIDPRVRIEPMPSAFLEAPRCRRRMQGFDAGFSARLGRRLLYIDLDVVIVASLDPILNRAEPIVGWRVGHAGVFSGSFLLADAGALHGAWRCYRDDPEGYPRSVQPSGVPSDQAMLNAWLRGRPPIGVWTERDGFVTYYGQGYAKLEHLGVGPRQRLLDARARIVVLGSADLAVLGDASYPFVRKHYLPLVEAVSR